MVPFIRACLRLSSIPATPISPNTLRREQKLINVHLKGVETTRHPLGENFSASLANDVNDIVNPNTRFHCLSSPHLIGSKRQRLDPPRFQPFQQVRSWLKEKPKHPKTVFLLTQQLIKQPIQVHTCPIKVQGTIYGTVHCMVSYGVPISLTTS